MKSFRKRAAASAGVAALWMLVVVGLAGCTPGVPAPTPTVTSTSSSSATPSAPSATPTPGATAPTEAATGALATRVIIFSGLVGAVDATESSIGLLDMFEPVESIDPVIDELSGYFGFAPVSELVEADPCCDGVTYTSYRWDGFEVRDWDVPASRVPALPEFVVVATASDVRGVRVESIDGASIGDSIEALEASNPGNSYRQTGQFGEEIVVRIMVMDPVDGPYLPVQFAVELLGPVGGAVTEIYSPAPDTQIY